MGLADILGRMAEAMRGPTLMIESTDLVFMFGQMGAGMRVTGLRASNMDRVNMC